MTRTPEAIKKGLECCRESQDCTQDNMPKCPYYEKETCLTELVDDSLALIQQLEAANAELLTKVKQLERERDAAVRDCGCFPCQTCEERENGDLCPMCEVNGGYRKFHQWRGAKEDANESNP